MPTSPIGIAVAGRVACLRHACGEVRVGTLQPLRDRTRAGLDLALELLVDDQVEPRRGREQLHRPVVVGRAEAPRDDAEVGLQALAECGRELAGRVADDRDPRGRDAERQELARQERPVQVGALAADELAAGDDDRGPRPAGGGRVSAAGGGGRRLPRDLLRSDRNRRRA